MTSTDSNAALLVKRIMAGDPVAESELVQTYSRGINLILRRESRSQDTAEDLFQDTFRIAIEKIRKGDLRDSRKLGSFLASIARFTVIDFYRAKARHDSRFEQTEEHAFAAPEESQLQIMMRQEQAGLIRDAIGALKSDRDRQILYRFFIAEDEKEDICRDLDLTSLHFNRVLHRAKQRYKELFLKLAEKTNDSRGNSLFR